MQQKPLVSIIVPNYNHAKFLNERLDSIFNQTFKNFEVILLDDKSTDNSVEVLNQYQDERITHRIYNTTNSGSPFKQWKKGFHLAKGELIWIAESDDVADATFLEKMVKIFDEHQNVAVAYCDMFYIDENSKITNTHSQYIKSSHPTLWEDSHYEKGIDYIKNVMLKYCFISNASGVLFKKEKGIKYVDKILNYRCAGDWLFWNSILSEEDVYVYFRGKEKLNYFRHHSQTTRHTTTLEKSQNNLLEASNVIYQTLKMSNLVAEKLELKRRERMYLWAGSHSVWQSLQKSFYKILDIPMFEGVSKLSLYKFFIKFKLRKLKIIKLLRI